ncbi:MAG: transposase [Candidatus Humimicrobiaceae bacterium]
MGQAKEYHVMDKAKFRGINKIQMQFLLTATAINLKKLVKMFEVKNLKLGLNIIKADLMEFKSSILRKLIYRLAI